MSTDKSEKPLKYVPIFIIGPPRSGSTLLYQCLLQRYEFGYISNLHHSLNGNPALAERLLRVSRWPRRSSFDSQHGNTSGWTGPSESWRYWYRFFPRHPQYVRVEDVDPRKMAELRGSIRALGSAFGSPVLFKNMTCALRLAPLLEYVPEARYLVTQRDLESTARSVLHARYKIHNNYSAWWSMEPPNFDELKTLHPSQQVVEQNREIYKEINRHRHASHAAKFHDVAFEDLCDSPEVVLGAVQRFLVSEGIKTVDRGKLPSSFSNRASSPLESSIEAELTRYINATSV